MQAVLIKRLRVICVFFMHRDVKTNECLIISLLYLELRHTTSTSHMFFSFFFTHDIEVSSNCKYSLEIFLNYKHFLFGFGRNKPEIFEKNLQFYNTKMSDVMNIFDKHSNDCKIFVRFHIRCTEKRNWLYGLKFSIKL